MGLPFFLPNCNENPNPEIIVWGNTHCELSGILVEVMRDSSEQVSLFSPVDAGVVVLVMVS